MLCRRSASLTITTRTSSAMATNILRRFSAWASRSIVPVTRGSCSAESLVAPSTSLAHVDAELGHQLGARDAAILHHIVQQCGLQSGHVELQLRAGSPRSASGCSM